MKKLTAVFGYLILVVTIGFHLVLNFPETKIMADPNDNIFQYSLMYRTDWVWQNYHCPFSLECLPNLTDHNVTAWAEGYPLPFYYSHLPQIATISSYHLLVEPLTKIFGQNYTLYQYYNLTKYLLLCFFPLSVFIALRILNLSPIVAAIAGLIASNYSTDGLYGIDPPSFLWRGWGLTSQLYAFIFLPIGLAYTYKLMKKQTEYLTGGKKVGYSLWLKAGIFLSLTTAGHLGMGMMGLMSTVPFLFLDLKIRNIIGRLQKMILVYAFVMFSLSYWIIPLLLADKYHIISFWDPIWKFNSYGWYEVIRQFLQGEVFDWLRPFPIITFIVFFGFFVLLADQALFPFAILFALWSVLYFGRTTWDGLIDLIPGMKDFHLHRYIVSIHIVAAFLIGAAIQRMLDLLWKITDLSSKKILFLQDVGSAISDIRSTSHTKSGNRKKQAQGQVTVLKSNRSRMQLAGLPFVYTKIAFYVISTLLFIPLGIFTVQQTIKYATPNNKWIYEANNAYQYDSKNYDNLVEYLKRQPNARVYAGRPGNWGHQFRLGSSQMYMLLGTAGFDMSQFLPETWSPLSENEQNFDERYLKDYNLLNIRYVVSSKNESFPEQATLVKKFGPFELYEVPTSGWFDIVTAPMFVKTDKTNFINIVQLWHHSFPRTWKMYPLISVEKTPDIPPASKRILTMTDEVSYQENGQTKNIFADFPFVFPESTPSGKIVNEGVFKQTYTGRISVPDKCDACYVLFKMSYHPNWHVTLDGKEVEKQAIFPFYMAVPVTRGEHKVEFTYQPSSLKVFLLIVELLVLAYFLLVRFHLLKLPKLLKSLT